jgi:predicted RNA binding protein YcfA (HicA-like mRNA interferase family)
MNKKNYSSAEIIKLLENAGFVLDRVKGSHHIYYNPTNKKRAVVPHPKKDLPIGTAKSILKQAGIE